MEGYVAGAGDVNGDGFGDVLVSARTPVNMPGPSFVSVFLGGVGGPSATPITLHAPVLNDGYFGRGIGGGADVNGDGYADILVADASNPPGTAYVYFGATGSQPYGVNAAPSMALPMVGLPGTFMAIVSAGDFDGDGYGDIAVGVSDGPDAGNQNHVSVFLGGSNPLASTLVLSPPSALTFPGLLAGLGDVNGDGFADLAIDTYNPSSPLYTTTIAFGAVGMARSPASLVTIGTSLSSGPQIAGTK